MSPQAIAHYRITAKLGEGGMGEVYRATDTKLGRDVAIKVIPDSFTADADRMARFTREAQVLASLNHPNIASIYGVEDRALVMELVEGLTLEQRIAQGAIPVAEALPLIDQLIEALEYAHDKGVIHRDLKPANIKLTPDGRVKVLDFGLAKALATDAPAGDPAISPTITMRSTQLGVIMGTAAYMAPEQARGHSVDKRADIWAFGVVVYEMVTGRRLFAGPTISDTLAAVLKDEPNLDRVPTRLRRLVRLCLAKDPRQRLRDISAARLLLDEAAEPASPRSKALWVTAAGQVILAAAALWTVWHPTSRSAQPLMQFSVDLGPDAIAGFRSTAALSPDGTRIVFQSHDDHGKLRLSTRLLNQPAASVLPGTENGSEPFFSPDGQWVGFWANGKMKKVAVAGSAAVTLCDAARVLGGAWGADDNIVASLGITGGLFRVPAGGGTPVPLTKPADRGEITHRWPQILPDGQSVLFTAHHASDSFDIADIALLSLKTGQWRTVLHGGYYGRYLPSGHLVYINQGNLFAVPFDTRTGTVVGTPVPVLNDVSANTTVGGGQFDFDRNGTFVYLRGKPTDVASQLAWVDASGKTEALLTSSILYDPRLSPDGKRVALANGYSPVTDLAIYDFETTSLTRITFNSKSNRGPAWSPDGKHIVYVSQTGPGLGLWWVRADGANEPQLLLSSKNTITAPVFHPGGRRLAYAIDGGDTIWDIWTLPLDLSDPEHPKPGIPEPFVHSPAAEQDPAFSPDGRWMAYSSGESGFDEVYVRPFSLTGAAPAGKWQVSVRGGSQPIWSPGAHQLFFQAPDGLIMVADYTAQGDTFTPGKVRPWYDKPFATYGALGVSRSFDVPTGRNRLLIALRQGAAPDTGAAAHMAVLFNFFDELRRRLPQK
jgi:serine/threonine-protein kinase